VGRVIEEEMKRWLLSSARAAVMRKREDASLRSALSVTVRRPLKRRNRGDGEI
jgi:hypothetical protein